MRVTWIRSAVLITGLVVLGLSSRPIANNPHKDFGTFVADQLADHAEQLFGFKHPLEKSALGPYDGPDQLQAIQVAPGLHVSLVSSGVASAGDQIAMWPDNDHPRYLFLCDEETTNPAVQRVDLSKPPTANTTTIVTGLSSCDPVRRTAWGTIIVAEEAGATGGLYELIDPVNINTAINVTDRSTGANTDQMHLVKRQAVGSLSFESFAFRDEGTVIYGDELAPSGGTAGGGIYKFVPSIPFQGNGPITVPAQSPLAAGTVYGLRVAASGSSNWGQGAETGYGAWVKVDLAGANVVDANGNIILRNAQLLQKFTGYYRPEDMDIDPIALEDGVFRACWANTGRMSHTDSSLVENSGVLAEIMCLVEHPPSTAVPNPTTGTIPVVTRFVTGSQERGMYDNVAFQPHSGNLVILEDNSVTSVTQLNPLTTELRGNDLWVCLPDGDDDDYLTDGCVRFASIRDTSAEPSGFIFTGSGESAYVHIQHRAYNDAHNLGALIKISGFKVTSHKHGHGGDDDDGDAWSWLWNRDRN
ncbi:MAG TPA: alkaline phosphatase PhoX [Vicinamibacterales bacterium]|nr:alkaline phosphatase PhoX [Vicinamibacterales bacterium]